MKNGHTLTVFVALRLLRSPLELLPTKTIPRQPGGSTSELFVRSATMLGFTPIGNVRLKTPLDTSTSHLSSDTRQANLKASKLLNQMAF